MDTIYIHGLKIDAIIGIFAWERSLKQSLVIDLEMQTDIRTCTHHEDIEKTISYKAVADRLIEFVSQSQYLLIETLAEDIAKLVLQEFPTPYIKLKLGKPGAVPAANDVGVMIERSAAHHVDTDPTDAHSR